jgi:hypothetical protein
MAEKPVPTDIKLGSSALFIPQACINCKHFRRVAHPAYEKPCATLGVLGDSRPCERFSPDPARIKFTQKRHASVLIDIMRTMNDSDLLTVASLMTQERRNRRQGYRFGDTVYLCAFGGDYISNYRRCKVVSVDGKYINIQADEGFSAMVYKDSVLSATQWRKKQAWLEARERHTDPRYSKYIPSAAQAKLQLEKIRQTHEALSLDFANGGEFVKGAQVERRSTRTTPLTELLVERPQPMPRRAVPATIRVR